VHPLSVLDIGAGVDVDEIAKLDAQVVTSHFVHLDSAFLDVIVAQADQNGVFSLLATANGVRCRTKSPQH
jgi:hypothetical protein